MSDTNGKSSWLPKALRGTPSAIVSSVIVGLLASTLTIALTPLGDMLLLWLRSFYRWLAGLHSVPGWLIFGATIITFWSSTNCIARFYAIVKGFSYTKDTVDGITWRWRWSDKNAKIIDLTPFCSSCDSELVARKLVDSFNSPATGLICEICRGTERAYERSYLEIADIARIEVERRIRARKRGSRRQS